MRPIVKIKTSCIPNPAIVPMVKHFSKSSTDIKSPPKKCHGYKTAYNNADSQHYGGMIVILVLDKIVKIRKSGLPRCDLNRIVLLHFRTPCILEYENHFPRVRRSWAAACSTFPLSAVCGKAQRKVSHLAPIEIATD